MTKKNWNHLSRRGLAMLLALIMCLGMLPVSVFADENDAVTNEGSSVSENAENGSVNQTEEEAEEPVQEEAEEPAQEETEEPTQEETEEPAQEENTSFLNTNTLSDRSNAPQAKLPCAHWDVLGVKSTWETVSTTPATCSEYAIEHQKCSKCGAERDEKDILGGKADHTWSTGDDIRVTTEPSCQVTGTGRHYCTVCGADKLEAVEIPKLHHDFVFKKDSVDLGSIGGIDLNLTHTVQCTRCGVVEIRDHDYVNTCVKSEYCSVCGHVKVGGALAQHQPDTEWTTDETNHWHKCVGDPDCTHRFDEAGHTAAEAWTTDVNQHWHVCGTCGAVVGDKANHTWNDGVVTTEPTTTTEGVKTFTCTACGATKTEDIDPTGSGTTVSVTGVTLNKDTLSLTVGGTETLTATVTPEDATDKTVAWISSDETVATVDATGKVTAVAAGSATITVTTADGSKTATCAVTVTEPESVSVAKIVRTGEEYATLQAAVNAASDGDTVELLKNTTGAYLATSKSIILNIPEGLTVTANTYGFLVQGKGAVLTITGAGTIQGGTYGVLAQKGATQLIIDMNGGKIEGGTYGVCAGSGTIVEVRNGNINAVSATKTSFGLYANGSTVAVSGGTISGTTYGLAAVNQAKVTVSGNAVIQSTPTDEMKADPKKYVSTAGIIIQNGPELILNGGTVTGGYTGISVSGYRDGTTKPATRLLMNGGIVTGEGFGIGGNGTWDYTDITIADGSVISENSTAIYHPQVGDLTISGGNISGVNGVQYSGAGDLTISGGRIMASLDYTEFPQKPSSQTDGTIADGAALSILSRGSGYQDGDQRMNVTITGGEFISVGNSAVAVYRVKQQADKTWVTGDVTGLSSYLASLDITGGTFTGNDDKGVLDIESIAMSAKSITGGYYSQDIDAGEVNYVDDGYASHPVSTPSGYFHVHQPAFSGSYSYDAANHWTGCTGHRDCLEGSVFEPHIWDNGVITVEPQVGVPGIRTFHCTVCEATRTETLPALMEDNIGGGADGRSPDGIPDIQEAVVYYTTSNEAYGTVAGAYQTFNLGSANASGTVTLGNTASTTTLSRTYFSSWTQSGTVLSTGTDLNVEFAVTAGSTYQVIANFGRTGTGGGGGGGTGGGGTTGGGGGGTTIVDEEVPLAGDTQLNRDDHFAYVSGYADGTVRPTNNITREEVAAIFYRLLTEESRAIYDTDVNDFSDVAGDRWSNRAISTLTNAGILSGYPDGTFRPGQTITRAEFAAIAAQFDVVTEGVENPFSDTTGHWAENLISFAAGKGWVSGYTDGTFLPQKAITRAEAMTLINNVLNRRVDAEGLLAEARQWSDNPEGTWYYYEVLEATNSHDYDRRTEGELVENWTAVTNG